MTTRNDDAFRLAVMDSVARMQGKLIRYSCRFFDGDEERARDVVQFAFLQLCRTDPESRPTSIEQWLYRVCRNRAIDSQRRNKRQQTDSQQCLQQHLDAGKESVDQLSDSELHQLVRNRIAELPESQGEAIDLWSFGLKYAEISRVMGRPENSVRVLVFRGLKTLRSDPVLKQCLDVSEHKTSITG